MPYLFANFLTDRDVYAEAIRFWEKMCHDLLGDKSGDWEIWPLNQGDFDGNPIFAILSRSLKKAVRIIQQPADSDEAEQVPLSSWTDTMGDDLEGSIQVQELVVHCILTEQTAEEARIIIANWFRECYETR